MESTNAKKGGNASYEIYLDDFAGVDSGALSMFETPGASSDDAVFASTLAEFNAETRFGESGQGLLAGL